MITLSEVATMRTLLKRDIGIPDVLAVQLLDTVEQLYHDRAEARELVTAMSCGTPGSSEQAFDLVRKWYLETLIPGRSPGGTPGGDV